MRDNQLSKIDIQEGLALKYSQSAAYYYTKSLNDFIDNARTVQVINFHYIVNYNDENEFLRRSYEMHETPAKIAMLTEYYKYHNEIPRCFLPFIGDLMSNYYDKKRRIEYFRIKRMIEIENKQHPNQPKKKIVGEEPLQSETQKSGKEYSNILGDITEVSRTIDNIKQKLHSLKLNVGDLQLLPSTRDQEQLDKFVQYISGKQENKKIPINQTPNSLKLPIGISNNTIKQVLSRKTINQTVKPKQTTSKQLSLYQQPSQIQSSPRVAIKPKPNKDSQFTGAQTQRIVKDTALSKLLSPLSVQITNFTSSTNLSNKCKTSVSISKQFKLTDTLKSSIRIHQHTRSDFRFFKKQ